MDPRLFEENAGTVAQLLTAMANEKRLMILCHLLKSELNVGELAALVDLAQSPLSQHLAKLRALGLVSTRREGQSIFYSLASSKAAHLLTIIYEIYCAPE